MNDAVQATARDHIFAASERDLQRQRERERRPLPPVPWRFHAGTWQRWSELDREFAPHEPPSSLVEHAQATGGPLEDEVLELVDGAWAPVGDHPASGDDVPSAPPTESDPAPAEFEAQIEAWRRRR